MVETEFRTYPKTKSVSFRKTTEEFGGLSNMAPGFPLYVAGLRIRTAEALYQACRFPHMPDVQKLIMNESSPMTAKMRSKPYREQSRPDWDDVRIPIMKWCLRVKLAQNWSSFGKLLRETGSKPIVEDSRKDDFWGAKVGGDGELHGRNVLGRLLMELREKLVADPESLTAVKPVKIPLFHLLNQEIGPIEAASEPQTNDGFGYNYETDDQRQLKLMR
jgi:ribA/ribD-fused uncharacterized protein